MWLLETSTLNNAVSENYTKLLGTAIELGLAMYNNWSPVAAITSRRTRMHVCGWLASPLQSGKVLPPNRLHRPLAPSTNLPKSPNRIARSGGALADGDSGWVGVGHSAPMPTPHGAVALPGCLSLASSHVSRTFNHVLDRHNGMLC